MPKVKQQKMNENVSKSKINKTPSNSRSSLNEFSKDDETDSEFDELNWLKEIGFNENGDLDDFQFSMASIKKLSKKHQQTIKRRLISIKKRRLKRRYVSCCCSEYCSKNYSLKKLSLKNYLKICLKKLSKNLSKKII